jgi:septal ring factor EnvC (AmiA/AmiB activator)
MLVAQSSRGDLVARGMLLLDGMRSLKHLIVALGLVLGVTACKSDAEKRAERVDNARDRVADKQNDLADEQQDVKEAKADLAQARMDFINAVDKQLSDIDNRITLAKANAGFDSTRVIQLRSEAAALRAQAADTTYAFNAETERATFDRIMRDIDVELGTK